MTPVLHEVVASVPLSGILRIDAGLEGDWSATVVPVWTREDGALGFESVARLHPTCRPSLEFYFEGAWVGVHCFRSESHGNLFDEELAAQVIRWVESNLGAD